MSGRALRRLARADEPPVVVKLTAAEAREWRHVLRCAQRMFVWFLDSDEDRTSAEEADVLRRLSYRSMAMADRLRANGPGEAER